MGVENMIKDGNRPEFNISINYRNLTIIIFSLFSSWTLSFSFQGQILYSLCEQFNFPTGKMIFNAMIALFIGLFISGYFIKSIKLAKYAMIVSINVCVFSSLIFFFPPSSLWMVAIILCGFVSGIITGSWGFFFKDGTPKSERIKTAADVIIYSNILMILLNLLAVHVSAYLGLSLAILFLIISLLFAFKLPEVDNKEELLNSEDKEFQSKIIRPMIFLCLFVIVITINSGLMYEVINPAYRHLKWLTSLYWAIPYISALFIMRNLPRKINRSYILNVGIAMIGFSFISFMIFNDSAFSYLIVNTLMLGAFGIYDLFWWSILGEILDYHHNPAKIFGIGMASNILGIILGSSIGQFITSRDIHKTYSTILALSIICTTFVILPPLHKVLSSLLKDYLYLETFSKLSGVEQKETTKKFKKFKNLSDRESEVASLLLMKNTYKSIGEELFISENTVKYYVKNIYSKFDVHSRSELIEIILKDEDPNNNF